MAENVGVTDGVDENDGDAVGVGVTCNVNGIGMYGSFPGKSAGSQSNNKTDTATHWQYAG